MIWAVTVYPTVERLEEHNYMMCLEIAYAPFNGHAHTHTYTYIYICIYTCIYITLAMNQYATKRQCVYMYISRYIGFIVSWDAKKRMDL